MQIRYKVGTFLFALAAFVAGNEAGAQTIQNGFNGVVTFQPQIFGTRTGDATSNFGGNAVPGRVQGLSLLPQIFPTFGSANGAMGFGQPIVFGNPFAAQTQNLPLLGSAIASATPAFGAGSGGTTNRQARRASVDSAYPPAVPSLNNVTATSERLTVIAFKDKGVSVPVGFETVAALCGDLDGCEVRLGRQSDNAEGRILFVSTMLHVNATTGGWLSNTAFSDQYKPKDKDSQPTNIISNGRCFLSDGEFKLNNANPPVPVGTDTDWGFGLVSLTQANTNAAPDADCVLTILD